MGLLIIRVFSPLVGSSQDLYEVLIALNIDLRMWNSLSPPLALDEDY